MFLGGQYKPYLHSMSTSKKLYLDTSVFGGYFDDGFEYPTKALFEMIEKNSNVILLSSLTLDELNDAPTFVKDLVNQLKSERVFMVDETIAAVELANCYIDEKVVGKTSFADCLHIALATVNEADMLISWNFKHIVNVTRMRGYNAVNAKLGYRQLEIFSPKQLFEK